MKQCLCELIQCEHFTRKKLGMFYCDILHTSHIYSWSTDYFENVLRWTPHASAQHQVWGMDIVKAKQCIHYDKLKLIVKLGDI